MSLLDGVRVIELATAWAGPFIGRFMGALGADVIKVESARQADGWRNPFPPSRILANYPDGTDPDEPSWDVAPNFNALNRNKRGIAVDVTTPQGRDLVLRLVARADVVAANFTARVLPQWRLAYDDLRAVKPDVVLLTMPALGTSGPFKDAVGYGTIVEGLGGLASRLGYRREGARVSNTYYPDAVAGLHATVAVLAALAKRDATGSGSFVDLSQQEAVWLQLGETIVSAARTGRDPRRMGNAEPGCAMSGVYPTDDDAWVAIVTRTPEEARRLTELSGVGPDSADQALASWTRTHSADLLLAKLRGAGVGAQRVNTYLRAPDDPAMRHAMERVTHPVAGEQTYLRVPVRTDGHATATCRPAPRFDQHTREVLDELASCTPEDLDVLESDGIIGGIPGRGLRRAP